MEQTMLATNKCAQQLWFLGHYGKGLTNVWRRFWKESSFQLQVLIDSFQHRCHLSANPFKPSFQIMCG